MIFDHLPQAPLYTPLHPHFQAAFQWLAEHATPTLATGRYEIQGDELIATVQSYETHPLDIRRFEAHRKYIDIQYIVSGTEKIYLGDLTPMTPIEPFNPEKDIGFYEGHGAPITLNAGDFLIIWPHEAHAPSCHPEATPAPIHKIVIKVAV